MLARHRRLTLAALAVGIGAIGIACSLNPQPLPPESDNTPAGGGDHGTDGSFSDATAPPAAEPDAGAQSNDAGGEGKNDGSVDAAPPDASDASTDAPSDALEDG